MVWLLPLLWQVNKHSFNFALKMTIYTDISKNIVKTVEKGLYSMFSDWSIIVYQLTALFILYLIVRFFFWKKITKFLDEHRMQEIKEKQEANKAQAEIKALKAEISQKYLSARDDIEQMRDTLIKDAQLERDEILAKAKKTAERRLAKLDSEIEAEIKEKEAEIKQAIKAISYKATKLIVKKEIDKNLYENELDLLIETELKNAKK